MPRQIRKGVKDKEKRKRKKDGDRDKENMYFNV